QLAPGTGAVEAVDARPGNGRERAAVAIGAPRVPAATDDREPVDGDEDERAAHDDLHREGRDQDADREPTARAPRGHLSRSTSPPRAAALTSPAPPPAASGCARWARRLPAPRSRAG